MDTLLFNLITLEEKEMKKTALIVLASVLFFVLAMSGHAHASWSQYLNENGIYGTPATHYNFTKYEGFIISDPAKTEWEHFTPDNSNWTSTLVNPTYSVMTGPAVSALNFTSIFSGSKYNGFVWDVVVWDGINIVGGGRLTGGNNPLFQEFSVNTLLTSNYNRTPVPVPGTYLLFASGLIGLIGIQRKKLSLE